VLKRSTSTLPNSDSESQKDEDIWGYDEGGEG
jgi:hypothetical protein